MKTSNYLIALAALTSLTLVSCSDNDFWGDNSSGDAFGKSSTNGQLAFRTGTGKTTRGEITGQEAAEKLGNKFVVYGWKYASAASDTAGFEEVFKDYVVKWNGIGSAGTTASNTNGWEYVGYASEPVEPMTAALSPSVDQTMKYWDWSTYRYDFIAWSIPEGNAQILSRSQVPAEGSTNSETFNEPMLTFNVPTAKDLGGIYVSDKFTSVPIVGKAPADYDEWRTAMDDGNFWTMINDASIKGVSNIPWRADLENHIGVYSQVGTNPDANDNKGVVNLQFRNLAAKVRIGIYETIPGYKVSDVIFYKDKANQSYKYTWDAETVDGEHFNSDYPANQYYATLFSTSNSNRFQRSGKLTVKYHDAFYHESDTAKNNAAFITLDDGSEKASYFAFGKLTNKRGTDEWMELWKTGGFGEIDTEPDLEPTGNLTDEDKAKAPYNYIGTTSATASMSIGNDPDKLYTYVFPYETVTPDDTLSLKVNYLLTATDGSGEMIRVTGANACIPLEFTKWRSNFAYTYLFKISDNTNGNTNPTTPGRAGLYPITFDACIVNSEEASFQETVTTLNDRSITTYQPGMQRSENDMFRVWDKDNKASDGETNLDYIYFTVQSTESALLSLKPAKGEETSPNVWLYAAYAKNPDIITEEAVANYKANGIVLVDQTSQLITGTTDIPVMDGEKCPIQFANGNAVGKFAPIADCYVIRVEFTEDDHEFITYKVIKVNGGEPINASNFTVSSFPSSVDNIGTTTPFTITYSGTNVSGNVTGAAGAFKVENTDGKDFTGRFIIFEGDDTNALKDMQYAIKSPGVPAGGYVFTVCETRIKVDETTDAIVTVSAPAWYDSESNAIPSVNIEEGGTLDVYLKAGSTEMEGFTPKVYKKLTSSTKEPTTQVKATRSEADGKITLTASKGVSGEFIVDCNGGELQVFVDKFSVTWSGRDINKTLILNYGDEAHKSATITVESESGSSSSGWTPTAEIENTSVANFATTDPVAPSFTIEAQSSVGATTTFTYGNAKVNIEVVNITLTDNHDGTVSLTKDGEPLSGATTFNYGFTPTSTPGEYKISGESTAGLQYKYRGIVVAEIPLEP